MSDFVSRGWSIYVAAATILGLIACLVLLLVASKAKAGETEGSGHVWDVDLRELNNPLPRWWMWLFVITVLFGGVYLVLFPGLGSAAGVMQWSSVGQYQVQQARATEALAPIYNQFVSMPAEQMAKNPAAMAIGERLFINNCSTCHGSDAKGSKGFPNLTDGDWLHGGSPEKIVETITDGRIGQMPPLGPALGSASDVSNVANYVLSLSGSPHNPISAALGKPKFAACAACHGADGKGNPALGAPNLTDKTWLHGWGEQAIVSIINNGKTNVMPAQKAWLTPEQIHVLGAYVWGLSQPSVAIK